MLGPLECVCYIWQLEEENHPSSFPFKLSPLSYLSHLVLCHSFSPSQPLNYHRYSGIWLWGAAGGAERCKVHFCPPVRACVGLGRGHQPKEPGQFYCPVAFQSKKPMVRRVFGRGWGGHGWSSGLNVTADCHRSSPALSRSVLPLEEPRGRQMHLPEIHTLGPDAYPPHLQGFTEMLHVPHTGVHLHSFKRAQRDIRLYSTSPWNFEPTN